MTHAATHDGWSRWHSEDLPVRLGVSSCLMGELCRYDGGHRRHPFVAEDPGSSIAWVPVCPEVATGMGTPRPALRLVATDRAAEPRMVVTDGGEDWTGRMNAFAADKLHELRRGDLDGYVFKRNSPSCGVSGLEVFAADGSTLHREGVGLFVKKLLETWPELPVEEEGRLDEGLPREQFVERVFARNRWRQFMCDPSHTKLLEFHAAHALQLRAHDDTHDSEKIGELECLINLTSDRDDETLYRSYAKCFAGLLQRPAARSGHARVMRHIAIELDDALEPEDRRSISTAIERYENGSQPRIQALTLLSAQVEKQAPPDLKGQLYLEPHPLERRMCGVQ